MNNWYLSEKHTLYGVPLQMQFKVTAQGAPCLFPFTVIFILPILKQKEKTTTTESYSHSFYFYSLTVIKDNSSSNRLTGNDPTPRLGEQTF